jgi:hypothetical protein
MKRFLLTSCSFFVLGLTACGGDDGTADTEAGSDSQADGATEAADGSDTGTPDAIDEDAELARAAAYETNLVQINATPFASQHGLAATVNTWVSPEAEAAFAALDPAAPVAPALDPGTMVLKEHLDAEGNKDGYLMMVKGPVGYAPDASDWWWARVDGTGATQETGQVGFCLGCHNAVAASGHLFGVPLDNRP